MGAVSCLNRFNMLSLYAILVLALSLNVDGKCQRGESSLCFVAEMPNLRLNKCCRGFECTELEGGNGDKFCMEKNATRLAEGESCKGGEKCKERVCVVPLQLGDDYKLPEGGLSRNCGKGLKCSKKEGVCVEKKGKGGKGKGKKM